MWLGHCPVVLYRQNIVCVLFIECLCVRLVTVCIPDEIVIDRQMFTLIHFANIRGLGFCRCGPVSTVGSIHSF